MAIVRTFVCAVAFGTLAFAAGCGGSSGSGSATNPPSSPTATITTLTITPSTAVFGATVILTASVTYPPAEAATGAVSFIDGTVNLGSSFLDPNGVGSLKLTTLAVGTHTITAIFAATRTLAASHSAALTVTVTASPMTKMDRIAKLSIAVLTVVGVGHAEHTHGEGQPAS